MSGDISKNVITGRFAEYATNREVIPSGPESFSIPIEDDPDQDPATREARRALFSLSPYDQACLYTLVETRHHDSQYQNRTQLALATGQSTHRIKRRAEYLLLELRKRFA